MPVTRSSARPSRTVNDRKSFPDQTFRPDFVPIQTEPLLSAARLVIPSSSKPSRFVKEDVFPAANRSKPSFWVPIQSRPALSSQSAVTCNDAADELSVGLNSVNLTPSKRARPALVPTHMNASRV